MSPLLKQRSPLLHTFLSIFFSVAFLPRKHSIPILSLTMSESWLTYQNTRWTPLLDGVVGLFPQTRQAHQPWMKPMLTSCIWYSCQVPCISHTDLCLDPLQLHLLQSPETRISKLRQILILEPWLAPREGRMRRGQVQSRLHRFCCQSWWSGCSPQSTRRIQRCPGFQTWKGR